MITTLPNYLARCSRKENGLADFNKVYQKHYPESEFLFMEFTDESFQCEGDSTCYLWLEEGEVSASYQGGPLMALRQGDVIALSPGESCSFEGSGKFWAIKTKLNHSLPFSGISRLSDLEATSGGCNDSENAFRRLQIVWEDSGEPDKPDGRNVIGCHVVWIAEDSSGSHYHPVPPTHGGMNQHEMYLVLDPEEFGFTPSTGTPGVWTYPAYQQWGEPHFTPLKPGDAFFIAAPAVHRAVDILTCVVALPGFKPDNELFVDQDIYDQSGGAAPCNMLKVKK